MQPGVMNRLQPQGAKFTPQASTGFEQPPAEAQPAYQPRVGFQSVQKPPSQQVKSQVYDFGANLPAQVSPQYQESPMKPAEQPSYGQPESQFYGYAAELPPRQDEASHQQYNQPPAEQNYQAQYEQGYPQKSPQELAQEYAELERQI